MLENSSEAGAVFEAFVFEAVLCEFPMRPLYPPAFRSLKPIFILATTDRNLASAYARHDSRGRNEASNCSNQSAKDKS
jgi:hypothetical protein